MRLMFGDQVHGLGFEDNQSLWLRWLGQRELAPIESNGSNGVLRDGRDVGHLRL